MKASEQMKTPKDHTDILMMLKNYLAETKEYWEKLAKEGCRSEYCNGAKQAIFETQLFIWDALNKKISNRSDYGLSESNIMKPTKLEPKHLEVIHASLEHYYHDEYAIFEKDLIVETDEIIVNLMGADDKGD